MSMQLSSIIQMEIRRELQVVELMLPNSGAVVVAIAAKANPVDQAENRPQATPNPGINIGSARVVL